MTSVLRVSQFARAAPPYSADEATMLRSFLDYFRATILRQAEGLNAEQLATPLPPAILTLGGMVKHLAWVENWWWVQVLQDGPELEWVGDAFENDKSATKPAWEDYLKPFQQRARVVGPEELEAHVTSLDFLTRLAPAEQITALRGLYGAYIGTAAYTPPAGEAMAITTAAVGPKAADAVIRHFGN